MDGMMPYILAGVLAAIAVAVAVAWKPVAARLRAREVKQAVGLFRLQREQLEALSTTVEELRRHIATAPGLGSPFSESRLAEPAEQTAPLSADQTPGK